jgi:hypothetical protein
LVLINRVIEYCCKGQSYHQRGEEMMPQRILPFKYKKASGESGMTAMSGLPMYLELALAAGMAESMRRHVGLRGGSQGWDDGQIGMSLVMLNVAGGECVNDLEVLERDSGFAEVMRKAHTHGMKRAGREAFERRLRRGGKRAVPSQSAVFRYLEGFHNEEEGAKRAAGRAFIPARSGALRGLERVNADFAGFVQRASGERVATLDMDATLIETQKVDALPCYKGYKAYQPLNVYWAEQELIVLSEFRDGNVPAGWEQKRVLEQALSALPNGVEKVRMRSDSAGYQWELLKYCTGGKNERFGVIEFAVGADVTPELKESVREIGEDEWCPLCRKAEATGQEWAESCFLPCGAGWGRLAPLYRFLVIREPLDQLSLPGVGEQIELPFPTMTLGADGVMYKIQAIVTNLDWPGDDVIRWYRGRCGKSEEAHSVLKEDLAGGRLPSGKFGANAAWWAFTVLAFNLNSAMKRLVLKGDWLNKRMKAIRFAVINLPGRMVRHARQFLVYLSAGCPAFRLILDARVRIASLAAARAAPE